MTDLSRESLALGWSGPALEHDPKKWTPVLGKDHVQTNNLERDDDSQKNHLALELPGRPGPGLTAGRAGTAAHLRGAVASGVAVTADGLSRAFGSNEVLKGLDLHVPAGQFLAIVGRSGSGKSTLLRILAGLDRPSGGRFWFGDGADQPAQDTARVMFQEHRLLPWARVLANVEVGLGPDRGRPGSAGRAREALHAVQLETREHEWPAVLSGGQKQRVALARALVSRPRLLALDEPLGALDALTRLGMQKLIEHVFVEQGFTAILVTHDVSEALTLADRIVLIEDGRITLDLPVDLPRPRRRGAVELAVMEEQILRHLLRDDEVRPEYSI
jgi:sulfonate transport system ATP-binding protein